MGLPTYIPSLTHVHPRTHARSERDKASERLKIVSEKFKFAKANAFIFSLQPSS